MSDEKSNDLPLVTCNPVQPVSGLDDRRPIPSSPHRPPPPPGGPAWCGGKIHVKGDELPEPTAI